MISRSASIIKQISAARSAQNAALRAGDIDAVAALWTHDVLARRGQGQAVVGARQYRAALEAANAAVPRVVYERISEAIDVSEHRGLAFETGAWVGRKEVSADGAAEEFIGGKYSAQWQEGPDKIWRISAEIFVALDGV